MLKFGDRSDTFEIDLTVGSDRAPIARGDAMLYPTLKWKRNQRVFFTRIVRGNDESTNLVHFSLEQGNAVLIAEERFRGANQNYDYRGSSINLWIERLSINACSTKTELVRNLRLQFAAAPFMVALQFEQLFLHPCTLRRSKTAEFSVGRDNSMTWDNNWKRIVGHYGSDSSKCAR